MIVYRVRKFTFFNNVAECIGEWHFLKKESAEIKLKEVKDKIQDDDEVLLDDVEVIEDPEI